MLSNIESVQTAINLLTSSKLKVDGFWGPASAAAYAAAPATTRTFLMSFATANGDASFLTPAVSTWITEKVLEEITQRVEKVSGVASSKMMAFVRLEANTTRRDGERVYDSHSISPSGLFFGLTQMGAPAWSDVVRAYKDTPVFTAGRFDAYQNVLAGARYALLNQKSLVNMGFKGEFTLEVMYATHNQGAAGFLSLIRKKQKTTNLNAQSPAAKSVIAVALLQSGVVLA